MMGCAAAEINISAFTSSVTNFCVLKVMANLSVYFPAANSISNWFLEILCLFPVVLSSINISVSSWIFSVLSILILIIPVVATLTSSGKFLWSFNVGTACIIKFILLVLQDISSTKVSLLMAS